MGCTRHCKFDFEMIFILNLRKCHQLTAHISFLVHHHVSIDACKKI